MLYSLSLSISNYLNVTNVVNVSVTDSKAGTFHSLLQSLITIVVLEYIMLDSNGMIYGQYYSDVSWSFVIAKIDPTTTTRPVVFE